MFHRDLLEFNSDSTFSFTRSTRRGLLSKPSKARMSTGSILQDESLGKVHFLAVIVCLLHHVMTRSPQRRSAIPFLLSPLDSPCSILSGNIFQSLQRRHSHFHHVFQVETSTSKVSFSTNTRCSEAARYPIRLAMLDSIRKHLPKSSVDILIFTMYSRSRPQLPKSRSQQIIETRGSALSHSTRHARFYQETSSKVFRRHSHFHHVFQVETSTSKVSFSTNNRN